MNFSFAYFIFHMLFCTRFAKGFTKYIEYVEWYICFTPEKNVFI